MIHLCFVCLGNICRSPTAEGVMQRLVDAAGLERAIKLDSAGTGAYHVGEKADPRSRSTAKSRGVTLTSISRQFVSSDLGKFEYVLAMDRENLNNLESLADSEEELDRLFLFLFLFRSFDC